MAKRKLVKKEKERRKWFKRFDITSQTTLYVDIARWQWPWKSNGGSFACGIGPLSLFTYNDTMFELNMGWFNLKQKIRDAMRGNRY